jgi:hypothetical protein
MVAMVLSEEAGVESRRAASPPVTAATAAAGRVSLVAEGEMGVASDPDPDLPAVLVRVRAAPRLGAFRWEGPEELGRVREATAGVGKGLPAGVEVAVSDSAAEALGRRKSVVAAAATEAEATRPAALRMPKAVRRAPRRRPPTSEMVK